MLTVGFLLVVDTFSSRFHFILPSCNCDSKQGYITLCKNQCSLPNCQKIYMVFSIHLVNVLLILFLISLLVF